MNRDPLSWLLGLAYGALVVVTVLDGRLLMAAAWFFIGAALLLNRGAATRERGRLRAVLAWGALAAGVLLLLAEAPR